MIHKSYFKYSTTLMFIICFCGLNSAQNDRVTSLNHALDTASTSSSKINAYKELGYYYQNVNAKKALDYFEEGIQIASDSEDSLQIANIYYSKGYTWTRLNELTNALSDYFDAARIYKKINDSYRLGNTYMAITNVYVQNGDQKKQQEYMNLTEDLALKENDSMQLSSFYGQKGVIYDQQNKLDSAVIFLKKGLNIGYAIKDTITIINGHVNLGLTQKHLNKNQDALENFRKALSFSSNDNNFYSLCVIHNNIGATYLQTKDFRLAESSFKLSIDYAKKAGFNPALLENYKNLSELYETEKAFEQQSQYLKKYYNLKDSLYTVEKETQLSQLESVYVIEKKDLQLETQELAIEKKNIQNTTYIILFAFSVLTLALLLVYYFKSRKKNQLLTSKNTLINKQKETLEDTLKDLKMTQAQLIQSEKMASLGELTAGIAHEIQNPLNFVNNFSEVSTELIEEMNEEINSKNYEDVKDIAIDVKANLEKIIHHGKRADGIVKGMLQHSRSGSGKKEPTDINKLADEYLRLAYHGLRAKDKSFNAELKSDYDESISKVPVISQDIGRVILNLFTNAFYAVHEKSNLVRASKNVTYNPTVSISTKKIKDSIEIKVSDNGSGISNTVKDKIFQPFFTTKPTGQGTGLGLSMSYDIITKGHGGDITVNSETGEGTTFTIILPIVN